MDQLNGHLVDVTLNLSTNVTLRSLNISKPTTGVMFSKEYVRYVTLNFNILRTFTDNFNIAILFFYVL